MFYFIVCILLFFTIKFLYDKYILEKNTISKGGIRQKYSFLIDKFLNNPDVKVISSDDHHLSIINQGTTTSTKFTFTQGFDVLIITWEFRLGNINTYKLQWNYDERELTQQQMMEKMMIDMRNEVPYI